MINEYDFYWEIIDLVLTLSYFSLLDIDLFFVLVTGPAGCDSSKKKSL